MQIKNAGEMSEAQLSDLVRNKNKVFYKSNFSFLCQHNGLRPGKIHVLMGTSGSGKSTFVRSIVNDFVKINPESVYFWLSEESSEDLIVALKEQSISQKILSQITVDSELENSSGVDEILDRVSFTGAKFLVIDNITTSKFYMDRKPGEQSSLVTRIKTFAEKNNIAVLLVAHTKKDVHDNFGRLITEGDIRGSGAVVMMAEFFYIIQKFQAADKFYPTLRIIKHRGQAVTERLYALGFDSETVSYTKDVQIDFVRFKELFNNRDKL